MRSLRLFCECGTRQENGHCPVCTPLSKPAARQRTIEKLLRLQEEEGKRQVRIGLSRGQESRLHSANKRRLHLKRIPKT